MTQYQIFNAVHKIYGYYIPKPLESMESAFIRAKNEAIMQLKKDLDDIENITHDMYKGIKK
jgi:hypothetical protein